MRFRSTSRLIVMIFCLTGLEVLLASAQEKQEKPAEPAKETKPNSAPAGAPQQNGLKNLEDDLFKPLKTFSPSSSLDGVFVPPTSPLPARPSDNKKMREKLDRDKNWIFLTPEEFLATPSTEEIFNVPGNDKKDEKRAQSSAFERYYRRTFHLDDNQDSEHTGDNKKQKDSKRRTDRLQSKEADDQDEDSGLPMSLRESKRALKSFSGDKIKDRPSGNNSGSLLTDIFGLAKGLPTPAELEQKRQEKERMNEFKKLLGVPAAPSAADSLNPLAQLGNPANPAIVDPLANMATPSSKANSSLAPAQLGTIGSFSHALPSSYGAPANAASASSFLNPAPVIEQPKPVIVANPAFTAPRRPF